MSRRSNRFIEALKGFRARLLGPRLDEASLRALDVETGPSFFQRDKTVTPTGIKGYYSWYTTDGVVFASVNSLAEAATGQGFYTKIDEDGSKRLKELVDEFGEALNLDGFLVNVTKNMLVAGFCPVETRINKYPAKSALKIVHPKTVTDIKLGGGEYHGVEYIVQKVGQEKPVKIEGKNLTWFVHNKIGNDPRGVSIIKPVESLLATKTTAIKNMDKIIERKLFPVGIWKTTRKAGPLKEAISKVEAGEDIFLGNLTPEEIKDAVQFINIEGDTKYWEYISYIDQLIYVGLYAPNLYYWRSATEASAKVLAEMVERNIRAIQRNVKRGAEAGFYRRLVDLNGGGEVPRLTWGVEKTGVEDLRMDAIISTALEVGMFGPEHLTRLLKMMGLDVGEIGWGGGEEEPEEEPEPEEEEPGEGGEEEAEGLAE